VISDDNDDSDDDTDDAYFGALTSSCSSKKVQLFSQILYFLLRNDFAVLSSKKSQTAGFATYIRSRFSLHGRIFYSGTVLSPLSG
jgi:hypothetical protein